MRSYITALFLFFLTVFAHASDDILQYKRDFLIGSIDDKVSVLEEMVQNRVSDTSLYIEALEFTSENRPFLSANEQLRSLALVSLDGLLRNKSDMSFTPLLWNVFTKFDEDKVREAIINVFSVGNYKNSETIKNLNKYVSSQAALREQNREQDSYNAAIKTLGQFADLSSFDALFNALVSTTDTGTNLLLQTAINGIRQEYDKNILAYIEGSHSADEKLAVFRVSMKNTAISKEIRGKIAQKALSIAINIREGSNISESVIALRQESLQEIYNLTYTPAAVSVINYFILGQTEFKNGLLSADMFINIINTLGSMQSADATKVLSGYLSAINSQAELNGVFDQSVVLSVINALGELGDKSSFDTLLYVSYIQNYPEEITEAARDALARLKW